MDTFEITGFSGSREVTERLLEVGFHVGTKIVVQWQLPFGGPVLVRFGSTVFALRKNEFECLTLKQVGI